MGKAAADGKPPPACVSFFDAVHLGKWTGYSLMRLGTLRWTSAAQTALGRTTAQWSGNFVRGSAEVSAACATAHIVQGEIEESVRWTRRAYDVAARTGSARNLRRVYEVRARLAVHARTRAVRELDDYLLTAPGSVSG